MKKLFGLIFVFMCLLCSCNQEPAGTQVEVSQKESDCYEVRLLFEVDGVKVYRFYDSNHYVYFTNCVGQTGYTYKQQVGKTTRTRHVDTYGESGEEYDENEY